jgi:hypothetical protein
VDLALPARTPRKQALVLLRTETLRVKLEYDEILLQADNELANWLATTGLFPQFRP